MSSPGDTVLQLAMHYVSLRVIDACPSNIVCRDTRHAEVWRVLRMTSSDVSDALAIRLTRFFMRFAGFWIWKNARGKLIMDLAMIYTIAAILVAWTITTTDLWYSRNDFYVSMQSFVKIDTCTIKRGTTSFSRNVISPERH